jgi:hypothetical protein
MIKLPNEDVIKDFLDMTVVYVKKNPPEPAPYFGLDFLSWPDRNIKLYQRRYDLFPSHSQIYP